MATVEVDVDVAQVDVVETDETHETDEMVAVVAADVEPDPTVDELDVGAADDEVIVDEAPRVVSLFAGEMIIDSPAAVTEPMVATTDDEVVVDAPDQAVEVDDSGTERADADAVGRAGTRRSEPSHADVDPHAVDDLFARLRAARAESVAERAQLRATGRRDAIDRGRHAGVAPS